MSDSIAKPSHGFPSKSSKNNFILEKHYLDLTVFSIYLEDLKFEKEIPFNRFQNQAKAKWINLANLNFIGGNTFSQLSYIYLHFIK